MSEIIFYRQDLQIHPRQELFFHLDVLIYQRYHHHQDQFLQTRPHHKDHRLGYLRMYWDHLDGRPRLRHTTRRHRYQMD